MVSFGRVAKLQVRIFRSALSYPAVRVTSRPVSLIQSRLRLQWGPHRAAFCSTTAPSNDIAVQYKHGRPMLEVPLPSRGERCLFSLRPMLMNVGDFIQDVQREDAGVTSAAVFTTEGERVSSATSIDTLLCKDFRLRVNDVTYHVHSPAREMLTRERLTDLEDIKTVIHMLHAALHLPGHHLLKEKDLLERLDSLKQDLIPLEKQVKARVARRAEQRSSWGVWSGLALLSAQGGVLAWFTWWVYSWDIMEPVTYFLTYATSIGFLSYFVLTKQDFSYPDSKDRQFLHHFYKAARKEHFDVQKYNKLKEEVAAVEEDLRRLRKPTQLQLPIEQIQRKD
ncbi:hypothetical protein MATL_G00194570 [Megalops atlanticus]|uniref:Calcium uniporter protein n=1 Tax=Megalops atlanticus TaxID=7932 RepID=A0A9D3PJF3_MEGAT|nr:hypothetical protein MATL_G00194570 [Megalops atlanticus]